jgi:predicted CXXCH cytochrome family protein
MGISHPVITPPMKQVYDTPYKPGPVVTFQHKEHIDLFGFRCVDCHRQENCGNCHDITKPAAQKKTQEQVHAVCNNCHKDAECRKCHDT